MNEPTVVEPRSFSSILLRFSPSLPSVLSQRFRRPARYYRPGCHECWRGHLLLGPFLRTNDEREQQTNNRALTLAFTGSLILSAAIGFLQSFGLHPVSWLGIPALMIILWSIGLILCSRRYR
jgi:hypothetical protein